ncbi:helix-turn-helix transcriptional regulator [Catenuloplanes atrovinosus]|uniref:DNA-binding CsgD family transcriptional regulator n=1 Tax=Catenuloplanes atrovinosus TaxID=137266 RepID=A0AAE4CAQ8_9ACTN|nr:LuxR C-terminal-related transcriptional regulator [Catenuloplanes atrovinosus]MDR7277287.1 DNA-binding CsgD family transcriptional regulator [Catenuloplanes atrovinosus]
MSRSASRRSQALLCGRGAQLAALDGAARETGGRGRLLLVTAPPGGGKTALLRAAVHGWRTAGTQVLTWSAGRRTTAAGAGDPYGFGVLGRLMRTHVERSGQSPLAGPLARITAPGPRVTDQVRALREAVAALTARASTVLAIDDADAIPAPALVLSAARGPGCLVVAACRTGGPAAEQLRPIADAVMDLPEFSESEVAEFLHRQHGAPPDPGLTGALREALGPLFGNPGTVTELSADLATGGRLRVLRGHLCLKEPHAAIALPETHPLWGRLRQAGEDAVRLAVIVSAVRLTVDDLPLLEDAVRADHKVSGRLLDELDRAGVLRVDADGVIAPVCPAAGARLRQSAGPVALARLHRAFAAALLRRAGTGGRADHAVLADRLTSAGDTVPAGALPTVWLTRAAASAGEQDADRAARWLLAAARHAGRTALSGRLLTRLAPMLVRTGQYRELGELSAAVAACDRSWAASTPSQRRDAAVAGLLAGLHTGSPIPARLRGALPDDAGLAAMRDCWLPGDPAAAVPPETGEDRAAGGDLEPSTLLPASEVARMAGAVSVRPDFAARRPEPFDQALIAAGTTGDLGGVLHHVLGPRYGAPVEGPLSAYRRLLDHHAEGALGRVLSAARELELSGAPTTTGHQLARIYAADALLMQGDRRRAETWLGAVPAEPPYLAFHAWARCGAALGGDDPPEQRAALHDGWAAFRRQRTAGPRFGLDQLLLRVAALTARLADEAMAAALREEAHAVARTRAPWLLRETVLLVRAVVDRDAGAAHAGLLLARRRGHRLTLLEACLCLGALLDDPRSCLHEAYELARSIDAAPPRSRVLALMRERGVGIPRPRRDDDRASISEARIITLIQAGLTNRQVALRLGISEKTVEYHLTRIFARTGHRSRVELVAASLAGSLRPAS